MIQLRAAIGILALWTAGCGTQHPAAAPADSLIDQDKFIEVYIELRRAAVQPDSTPNFELRKREVLERHGISGQELIDYVEFHSYDFQQMATVWDTIYQRLDRLDST